MVPLPASLDGPITENEVRAVEERKRKLLDLVQGTSHHQSKEREFEALGVFIGSHPDAKRRKTSALDATPQDIADFLLFRDLRGKGRTLVHKASCPRDGACDCPRRMGAESVRTMTSKIRTRFYDLGSFGALF